MISLMIYFYKFQALIMEFINLPDHLSILFMLNYAGILMPMTIFPDGFKNKISYFIKLEQTEVTLSNYESILLYGDISPNPIDDLKAITENVSSRYVQFMFIIKLNIIITILLISNTQALINLFSTKDNFKQHSDDIVVDFQDRLYDFLTIINNISGSTKTRSSLILPYGSDKITNAIKDFETR